MALRIFVPLIAAPFLGAPVEGACQGDTSRPLNVLWLTVEDMSPWIGPYGDETVPTPRLDAFAAESLRYDNAFACSPVCSPARTAILTGIEPPRMGAMHMRVRSRSKAAGDEAYAGIPLYEAVPPAFVEPFPRALRRAGWYATNHAKTDYQFKAPADTWDASSGKAEYTNRPDGAPFFAVYNHTGTHESQAFPSARRRASAVSLEDVPVPPIYPDTPAVRDAMKRTYDNIAAMDRWFGAQLDRLEESGLADSTVVFFFSDHGVGLPRGKRSLYGTGTRVPLLVRFPAGQWPAGIGPGTSTERLVSFVDFGPTVLSLAGIEPDERLDGRAFLGEHEAAPRDTVFFHADRFDAARDRARGATDGRYLVIHNLLPDVPHLIPNAYRERLPMTAELYALRDGGAASWTRTPAQWQVGSSRRPEFEWYDSLRDPWEVRNLAGEQDLPGDGAERLIRLDAMIAARRLGAAVDLGLIEDEAAMVAEHLWPPDGAQPTTAAPTLGTDGRLSCRTEGGLIAVRVDGVWRPYDGAPVPRGEELETRAHRVGFRPSAVVTLRP
ncbi:MAG: sulfatase [Planctomycetota bacterium]|nr:sulfatase [Planctomycetota bacterium]MEC8511670.1 sulfatase [Planctomycetota bacterium]